MLWDSNHSHACKHYFCSNKRLELRQALKWVCPLTAILRTCDWRCKKNAAKPKLATWHRFLLAFPSFCIHFWWDTEGFSCAVFFIHKIKRCALGVILHSTYRNSGQFLAICLPMLSGATRHTKRIFWLDICIRQSAVSELIKWRKKRWICGFFLSSSQLFFSSSIQS